MDWRCGSSSTAPTLQAQSLEFKRQSCQRERERKQINSNGSAQSSVSLFINPWDALDNYWVFLCDHRKSKTLVNPCPKISPFNPFRGPSSHQSQLSTSSQYLISKYRDQEQCYISVIPATWEAEIGVQG
jgi:hypothetical protein